MDPADPILRLNAALEGRYRIQRVLGEGGMAVVYLADDLRHGRQVALKVLRAELAAVVGATRFLAEIKTTAGLQHPHILPLFDSGEADGFLFYVMPFVEGETLRDRLDRERQLPVEEAVRIATDVAEALQVAHEKGVIHRDIKPSNILLSKGRPIVADFGIALAVSTAGGGRLTETGLSLGTPYYMSPEQASADREPGAASDVYSLGCVLYEMLVGEPPHTGSSAQMVLAKILTKDARAPTGSRASIPGNVDAAVRKALERLPADRFRGAQEFARALATPGFTHGVVVPGATAGISRPSRRPRAAYLGATVALAALAAWGWLRPSDGVEAGTSPIRVELTGFEFSRDTDRRPAIARDGSFLVLRGPDEEAPFFMRSLDAVRLSEIAGTEGGVEPALSPDGEWLAFRKDQEIFRVELPGGTPLPVATGFDPHWGANDVIVFGAIDGRIYSVSPGGGDPTPLQADDERARGSHPHLLPDGRGVLFQALLPGDTDTRSRLMVLDVRSGFATDLGIEGANPTYVSTGHLLFSAGDGSLMAVPFDLGRREVTASPFTALTGLLAGGPEEDMTFSVSDAGTAVYLQRDLPPRDLVERSLDGTTSSISLGPGDYQHPRYSPDGRHIAYESGEEIRIYDRETGSNERFGGEGGSYPTWSADGRYLYFSPSNQTVARRVADGSADAEVVHAQDGFVFPLSSSRSGTELILLEWAGPEQGLNLRVMDVVGGETTVRDFLRGGHQELGGEISPDGEWVAYLSDESGQATIYMRRLADATGQTEIATASSLGRPVWGPGGAALYYMRLADDGVGLMRVPITVTGGTVAAGEPEEYLTLPYGRSRASFSGRNWDLSPDGRRFVAVVEPGREGPPRPSVRAELVVNWFEELRGLTGG